MRETLDQQLISAAARGDFKTVERALGGGADVHIWNDAALRLAASNGHTAVVDLLLKSGADIHANDDYAVRLAACYGYTGVIDLLLKAGADVHANNDVALQWAAYNGHTDVANALIQHGADLTALHQEELIKKQITCFLKHHAVTAYRGVEAVMMLEEESCLDVLCHLYPELKPKQIRDELAMMQAMGLDTVQMAEMWQARHGGVNQPQCIGAKP